MDQTNYICLPAGRLQRQTIQLPSKWTKQIIFAYLPGVFKGKPFRFPQNGPNKLYLLYVGHLQAVF
jgi:hypothetical protein